MKDKELAYLLRKFNICVICLVARLDYIRLCFFVMVDSQRSWLQISEEEKNLGDK